MTAVLRKTLGYVGLFLGVIAAVQLWQVRDLARNEIDPRVLQAELALLQPDRSLASVTFLEALNGLRAAYPGQPVVIHIWAEWCSICRIEENSISRLDDATPVLTVAMQSGTPDAVASLMADRGLHWKTLVDPRGEFAAMLGVRMVPTFFVIDEKNRLRTPAVGYTSELGMRLRRWWAAY
jgi:thiol-disulfide isomerase/thioredoxin